MITIESVIARVSSLRQDSMQAAVRANGPDRPEFEYGVACGRDSAFALVLEAMDELIEEESQREKREED